MKFRVLLLSLAFSGSVAAQQNLVPNPSFEDYTDCPNSLGQIWQTSSWLKVGGDGVISFYTECSSNCCNSENNALGIGGSYSGNSMADLVLLQNNHVLPFHAEGNFLGAPLTSLLEANKKYRVQFFLSLADNCRFASKNIGVYFSYNQPSNNIDTLLSFEPQVRYEGDFLTDKIGWMEISGEFIAQGGENFLTIGNFDGYYNSDTLNLHEGSTVPSVGYWEVAQYFIDDVSLHKVDTTVGIGEKEEPKFEIFPNPVTEQFSVNWQGKGNVTLQLTDATGRVVLAVPLQGQRQQIDATGLPQGVYVAQVVQNGVVLGRKKVLKL